MASRFQDVLDRAQDFSVHPFVVAHQRAVMSHAASNDEGGAESDLGWPESGQSRVDVRRPTRQHCNEVLASCQDVRVHLFAGSKRSVEGGAGDRLHRGWCEVGGARWGPLRAGSMGCQVQRPRGNVRGSSPGALMPQRETAIKSMPARLSLRDCSTVIDSVGSSWTR